MPTHYAHNFAQKIVWMVLFLGFFFFITTSLTPNAWTLRNMYYFVYFFSLSALILSSLALLFLHPHIKLSHRAKTRIFLSAILAYIFIFILSNIVFLMTGQIIRLQILAYIPGVASSFQLLLAISFIFAFFLWITSFIHKKIVFVTFFPENEKSLRIIALSSFCILVFLFVADWTFLDIHNPILEDNLHLNFSNNASFIMGTTIANLSDSYAGMNVVLILLESVSAERLGSYGYDRNVSPHIDALAREGILFSNAYSTAVHTEYAQPSLFSSRYMLTNNIHNSLKDESPRTFVWDVFAQNEYTNAYFTSQDGRWQNIKTYMNFDSHPSLLYVDALSDGLADYGVGYFANDYDENTTTRAINWLVHQKALHEEDASQSQPFLLLMNFQATHVPMVYPKQFDYFGTETENDKFDNALRYVDTQVGRIVATLDELNISNSTMIFVTSDHGHDFSNRHYINGHGLSLYNDELQIPFIAKIPGITPQLISDRVSHIQFVPTLLDLMNFNQSLAFQGDIMRKNSTFFFVAQTHRYQIGMIEGHIKVIIDVNKKQVYVFDLDADPLEEHPLDVNKYKEQIQRLRFWQFCQLEYYENELWRNFSENACTKNNNFFI